MLASAFFMVGNWIVNRTLWTQRVAEFEIGYWLLKLPLSFFQRVFFYVFHVQLLKFIH